MKRVIGGMTLAACLFGGAGAAFAATPYPSAGGVSEYGNGQLRAYSYYTVKKCHGSSIKDGSKTLSRSVDTASGRKSIAEYNHQPWQGGYDSFYRIC